MAAVVTFGVDATLLAGRFFGTGMSDRFAAVAGEVIEEVASDVETHVRAASVDPATVTEADNPLSYRWLQTTILYGVAAEASRRVGTTEPDTVEQWDEKFAERMRLLRTNANTVLSDITSRTSTTRTLYAFR